MLLQGASPKRRKATSDGEEQEVTTDVTDAYQEGWVHLTFQ